LLDVFIFLRDGSRCPVTNQSFAPIGRFVVARAAHILPFSFHDKVCDDPAFHVDSVVQYMLAFDAQSSRNFYWAANINHPCNAFNVESNAHDMFDKIAWGVEAVREGTQVNTSTQ